MRASKLDARRDVVVVVEKRRADSSASDEAALQEDVGGVGGREEGGRLGVQPHAQAEDGPVCRDLGGEVKK